MSPRRRLRFANCALVAAVAGGLVLGGSVQYAAAVSPDVVTVYELQNTLSHAPSWGVAPSACGYASSVDLETGKSATTVAAGTDCGVARSAKVRQDAAQTLSDAQVYKELIKSLPADQQEAAFAALAKFQKKQCGRPTKTDKSPSFARCLADPAAAAQFGDLWKGYNGDPAKKAAVDKSAQATLIKGAGADARLVFKQVRDELKAVLTAQMDQLRTSFLNTKYKGESDELTKEAMLRLQSAVDAVSLDLDSGPDLCVKGQHNTLFVKGKDGANKVVLCPATLIGDSKAEMANSISAALARAIDPCALDTMRMGKPDPGLAMSGLLEPLRMCLAHAAFKGSKDKLDDILPDLTALNATTKSDKAQAAKLQEDLERFATQAPKAPHCPAPLTQQSLADLAATGGGGKGSDVGKKRDVSSNLVANYFSNLTLKRYKAATCKEAGLADNDSDNAKRTKIDNAADKSARASADSTGRGTAGCDGKLKDGYTNALVAADNATGLTFGAANLHAPTAPPETRQPQAPAALTDRPPAQPTGGAPQTAGGPVSDYHNSPELPGKLAQRQAAIEDAVAKMREKCAGLITPETFPFDKAEAVCKNDGSPNRIDLPLWNPTQNIQTSGDYNVQIGCRSRYSCKDHEYYVPEAVYSGMKVPPARPDPNMNPTTIAADIKYYSDRDEGRGKYSVVAHACYSAAPGKSSPEVTSACAAQGATSGMIAMPQTSSVSFVGETSGAVLTFGCSYACACGTPRRCDSNFTSPDPSSVQAASAADLAAIKNKGAPNPPLMYLNTNDSVDGPISASAGTPPGGGGSGAAGAAGASDSAQVPPAGPGAGGRSGRSGGRGKGATAQDPDVLRQQQLDADEALFQAKMGNKNAKPPAPPTPPITLSNTTSGSPHSPVQITSHYDTGAKPSDPAVATFNSDYQATHDQAAGFKDANGKWNIGGCATLLKAQAGGRADFCNSDKVAGQAPFALPPIVAPDGQKSFQYSCTCNKAGHPQTIFVSSNPPIDSVVTLTNPKDREEARLADWDTYTKDNKHFHEVDNACKDIITAGRSSSSGSRDKLLANADFTRFFNGMMLQCNDKSGPAGFMDPAVRTTKDSGLLSGAPLPYQCQVSCNCDDVKAFKKLSDEQPGSTPIALFDAGHVFCSDSKPLLGKDVKGDLRNVASTGLGTAPKPVVAATARDVAYQPAAQVVCDQSKSGMNVTGQVCSKPTGWSVFVPTADSNLKFSCQGTCACGVDPKTKAPLATCAPGGLSSQPVVASIPKPPAPSASDAAAAATRAAVAAAQQGGPVNQGGGAGPAQPVRLGINGTGPGVQGAAGTGAGPGAQGAAGTGAGPGAQGAAGTGAGPGVQGAAGTGAGPGAQGVAGAGAAGPGSQGAAGTGAAVPPGGQRVANGSPVLQTGTAGANGAPVVPPRQGPAAGSPVLQTGQPAAGSASTIPTTDGVSRLPAGAAGLGDPFISSTLPKPKGKGAPAPIAVTYMLPVDQAKVKDPAVLMADVVKKCSATSGSDRVGLKKAPAFANLKAECRKAGAAETAATASPRSLFTSQRSGTDPNGVNYIYQCGFNCGCNDILGDIRGCTARAAPDDAPYKVSVSLDCTGHAIALPDACKAPGASTFLTTEASGCQFNCACGMGANGADPNAAFCQPVASGD